MQFTLEVDLSKVKYMTDGSVVVGNVNKSNFCGFILNGDFLNEILTERKVDLKSHR